MDFEILLNLRQSKRKYQERQITEDELKKILNATNKAPIGSNKYEDIHLTVVQKSGSSLKTLLSSLEKI